MEVTTRLTKDALSKQLKKIASKFPRNARMEYALENNMGLSTVYEYLNGKVSSTIIGNHLLEHIKAYSKKVA